MTDHLEGIWTALWTPTDAEGNLLKDAIKSHLRFLKEKRVRGVAVCGTTGEFPYIDIKTRKELIKWVLENANGLEVFVNISDIRPKAAYEMADFVRGLPIKAIMLLPPMYFPFAQVDLVHYFVKMADRAGQPLILYNFPECVRNRIDLDTVAEVADRTNLVGIKQSGSDFDYHKPLVELGQKKHFLVFTGHDTRLFETMKLGVRASIGGLSNAVPELITEIYQMGLQGKEAPAIDFINQLAELLDQVAFPLNVAALMEARGLVVGARKCEVSSTTEASYQKLKEAFKKALIN